MTAHPAILSPVVHQRTGSETTGEASDLDLIPAIAGGDRGAFGQLYRRHRTATYRQVHRIIRDPDQAEEVTQEVFLAVWRQADRFDPARGTVSGFLSVLAHAKAVDRVRSSQAARDRDLRYMTVNVDLGTGRDPVFELIQLRAEHSQVREALAALTLQQREAITLHYFDRYTYLEVGALLGVSPGTVKTRVHSGMAKLRNRLAEHWSPESVPPARP
ncbi:RNA polymerase sigma-70 factor (ECF subfamily) [Nakamurella sp. UYEF19]|uniref:sigma-70 family RNA polymerase sigma factor n=1 Tax=Nakamurella sp. UYEF19 TaxID=1756392 RepID=UPI0033991A23